MAAIVRFVDAVGSTTTRLDISPGGPNDLQLGDGVDFGRPKLDTTTADAATGDGDPYVASRYGNRQISLPLVLPRQASMTVRQAAFGALARELDRPSNVLMVQPDGAPSPRWLVTHRASDAASWLRLGAIYTAGTTDITINAQPFAYGALVTVTTGPVSGNPESGTWIYTIPAISGDVDAPLNLDVYNPGGAPPAQQFILVTRPMVYSTAGTTYIAAAPAVYSADVTLGVTSTGAAAGTATRWTPPGSGTGFVMTVSPIDHSGAATRDMIGRWRILYRVKRSSAAAVFKLHVLRNSYGGARDINPYQYAFGPSPIAGWLYADVGVVQLPGSGQWGADPFGNPLPVSPAAVQLYATRVSGTGTLDIDHVLAVPADGRYLAVNLNGADLTATNSAVRIDADRNQISVVQAYNGSAYSDSLQPPTGWTGGMLRLTPRYSTQLFGIADATDGGSSSSALYLSGSYRPRYLDAL